MIYRVTQTWVMATATIYTFLRSTMPTCIIVTWTWKHGCEKRSSISSSFIDAVIMLWERLNLHYHHINLFLFDFKFTFFYDSERENKKKTNKGWLEDEMEKLILKTLHALIVSVINFSLRNMREPKECSSKEIKFMTCCTSLLPFLMPCISIR